MHESPLGLVRENDMSDAMPDLAAASARRIHPAAWALAALILAGAIAWVYAPLVRDDWIRYDNETLIRGEPRIRGPLGEQIIPIFTGYHHDMYQPLLTLSLAFDYALNRRKPVEGATWPETDLSGWHAHSLVLHIVNMVLLMWLLVRLGAPLAASCGATVLVALHPLMVEPVGWLICRTFLVAGLWLLVFLHLYLTYARRGAWWAYALALVCFVLSMMAKPIVGMVLAPLLIDLWLKRGGWMRLGLEKVPFVLAAGAFVVVNLIGVRRMSEQVGVPEMGWGEFALRAAEGLVLTAGQTLWPAGLAVFYPPGALGAGGLAVGLATGVAGALGAAGILAARKRSPLLLLCLLGWGAALVPQLAANRVRYTVTADRYSYVPLWFLAAAVAGGIVWLARRAGPAPHAVEGASRTRLGVWAPLAVVVLLACVAGPISRGYAKVWTSDVDLWRRVVARTPHVVAWGQLGNALLTRARQRLPADADAAREDFLEAERAFTEGLKLAPDDPTLTANLASLHLMMSGSSVADRIALPADERARRVAEAERLYRRALEVYRGNARAWNGLGVALMRQRRYEEAEQALRRALEIAPGYVSARNNLERVRRRLGETPQAPAEGEASDVLQAAADLAGQKDYGAAVALIEQGLGEIPESEAARKALANYYVLWAMEAFGQRDFPATQTRLERAIACNPQHTSAAGLLGIIYAQQQRWTEAIPLLETARQDRPGDPTLRQFLIRAYEATGRTEDASRLRSQE